MWWGLTARKTDEFLALEREWYSRLKDEGFPEIEDVEARDRPLVRWTSSFYHSHKELFTEEAFGNGDSSFPEKRFTQDEQYLFKPEFMMVCESISRHKNCSLHAEKIVLLWEKHCDGISNRAIAVEFGVSEASIRRFIAKVNSWMRLL